MFFENLTEKLRDNKLFFEAVVPIDDNYAYGASTTFNGLFFINLNNGECEFVSFFLREGINKERMFVSACLINNKIYFAPNSAKFIHVFFIDTKEVKIIEINENTDRKYSNTAKFGDSFVFDNYVYMIGTSYPAILKINPVSDEIEYYPYSFEDNFYFRKGLIRDDKYYVTSANSGLFIEVNLKNMNINKFYLYGENRGSIMICQDVNSIWFPPIHSNCSFIKWNPKTGKFREQSNASSEYTAETRTFVLYSYYSDDFVYSVCDGIMPFIRTNVETMNTEELKINIRLENNVQIVCCFVLNEKAFITIKNIDYRKQECINATSFYFNFVTQELIPFNFIFKYKKAMFLRDIINYSSIRRKYERNWLKLEDLMKMLFFETDGNDAVVDVESCGQMIWKQTKKETEKQ